LLSRILATQRNLTFAWDKSVFIMGTIGIIAGTIFLHGGGLFSGGVEELIETPYGGADVFHFPGASFIPRHGHDSERHIFPHEINNRANLYALRSLGVREVISINSTGSLKRKLAPGTLVVPDDFILLSEPPTTISGRARHITPSLDEDVRRCLIETARIAGVEVATTGTYWQATGPRLETRAEIRMMSRFADIVGMTMAGEAVTAQELGLKYAGLCSVDNYAHGLVDKPLTMEEIVTHANESAATARKIAELYVEQYSK
jgi:5'-methylthioadenosine phosphorylase